MLSLPEGQHFLFALVSNNRKRNSWRNTGPDEMTEQAARELQEETGVADVYLEQLYTFSDVGRAPRARRNWEGIR